VRHGYRYCNWLQRTAFGNTVLVTRTGNTVTVLPARRWTVRAIYPRAMLFNDTMVRQIYTNYHDFSFSTAPSPHTERKQDFKSSPVCIYHVCRHYVRETAAYCASRGCIQYMFAPHDRVHDDPWRRDATRRQPESVIPVTHNLGNASQEIVIMLVVFKKETVRPVGGRCSVGDILHARCHNKQRTCR